MSFILCYIALKNKLNKKIMEHLYDLSANSNHVKFFKWLWGVDPSKKYKTMCPYFWAFVGSILILPIILVWNTIIWLIKPICNYFESKSQKQIDEFLNNLYLKLDSGSYTDYDLYKIHKSKCYKEHYYKFISSDRYKKGMTDKIDSSFNSYWDMIRERKREAKQTLDNFKYGFFGKAIAYIIGLTLLGFLGWGVYEFVHLFTMGQFLGFLKGLGLTLLAIGGLALIIAICVWFNDKYGCNSYLNRIVFWKHIGDFFKVIGNGFLIVFDMIKNVYKQNCPIIHWD
tara:strand:- start:34437 stop:35288 length:852 start_codon:yes stop_codon:yes gene_type:complete